MLYKEIDHLKNVVQMNEGINEQKIIEEYKSLNLPEY